MSTPYTVICHRCGKPTFVDLTRTISDQRCRSCRGFLHGVDVSVGDKADRRRKLVVKVAGAGGREPEWADEATAVVPRRQRWPRFFRWVVWGSVIALVATFVRIAQLQWQEYTKTESKPAPRQADPVKVDPRETAEWSRRASEAAKKVLRAKTVAELLPLLYHPEVEDDVIRRYYDTEETLPIGSDLNEYDYVTAGGYRENVAAFRFIDVKGRPRSFVVVERKEGMRVDWPSFVGLGEMTLKEYIRSAPAGVVVMRARARLGEYYNNYFSDGKRWLSVRLCDVTDENVLHAYFDRNLPGSEKLAEELPNPSDKVPRPDVPVVVVLKNPAGNLSSDQTQLVAFISATWYLEDGLKPLVEHARKLDEVRNALNGEKTPAEKSPAPVPPSPQPQPVTPERNGSPQPPPP